MKTVHILLVVLLSLARCKKLTLSYIVEHELDQADNYVEVALTLTVEGPSLSSCIYSAKEISRRLETSQGTIACRKSRVRMRKKSVQILWRFLSTKFSPSTSISARS